MTAPTYRTAGPWGAGLGTDLTAAQVDMNFWVLYSLIVTLQSAEPITISYFTVTGNQMWITMTDHYVFGPFTIPTAVWNFKGSWVPNGSYNVNDVFTYEQSVWLCIWPITNTGLSFYSLANDGDGHNYFALLLAAPPNPVPTNGLPGQVLQWTGIELPGPPYEWSYIKRNIAVYLEEPPEPLEIVAVYAFTESTQFAVNFAGSSGASGTNPSVEQDYQVYQNDANIGTISFLPSPTDALVFTAPTAVTFHANDVMTIVAPAVPDPHLTEIAFTLMGVVVLP